MAPFPKTGITGLSATVLSLYMGAGDLGLGIHAWAVKIIPTKPSPQSLKLILIKPSNVAGLDKSVHENQMQ